MQVYIAEISSVKLRGIFGTLTQIMLTSGIVVNYAMGAIDGFPYYYISLVAVGIVALFEVLMIWLPETPRWLLSRGYREDAKKVLLWLRGKKIGIHQERDEMKKAIITTTAKRTKVRKEFLKRNVFVPFIYVLTFSFIKLEVSMLWPHLHHLSSLMLALVTLRQLPFMLLAVLVLLVTLSLSSQLT